MCGRFFVDAKNREIDRLIDSLAPDSPPVKLGEIFPTNNALVLGMKDGVPVPAVMSWGFPRWDGKGVIFNARAESAMKKPMFSSALRHNPLLIPASGFYEWKKLDNSKEKYFFTGDRPLLYMAAFWKEINDDLGEVRPYFTILTTEANASMRPYHSRMPLLLSEDEKMPWLRGEDRSAILSSEPNFVHAKLI